MRVRPFNCLHPTAQFAEAFQALPYDVFTREEAAAYVAEHPLSFLAIDRPETAFPPEYDMYAPEVYQAGAALLAQCEAEGVLEREASPCYYVYELSVEDERVANLPKHVHQIGVVGVCDTAEYQNGVIKRHESTRVEKELDRIRHIEALSAQTGPIFLAYRDQIAVDTLVERVMQEEPLFDFADETGVRQTVWRVCEPTCVAALEQAFAQVPAAYIADGHHRAASAVKVSLARRKALQAAGTFTGEEEANRFLAVLFPAQQLHIFPYNRVVADLNGHAPQEFLEALKGVFHVEPAAQPADPTEKGQMGLCLGGAWYTLRVRDELRSTHPVDGLDVTILQQHVLKPLLGITDPRTNPRISFVDGLQGAVTLEDHVQAATANQSEPAVGFALFPTSIHELMDVADAGLLMPPKSTWFEPKLRSGLFIHEI